MIDDLDSDRSDSSHPDGHEADSVADAVADLGRSFDDFYRRAYPDIVRTLSFTLTDAVLGAEAADEAMARTYARWDQVRHYDNPAGWTYRVGLNWARSTHRRLARQLPFVGRATAIEPTFRDPAVAEALRSLDIDLRAVVVCRLLADWSVAETAAALHLNPGTVKSRLHRALTQLERKLEAPDHLRPHRTATNQNGTLS